MNEKIIIGDVHGCIFTLENLLSILPKNAEIIYLGDLCNKGKYSKEVIEFVKNNNNVCLLGNHEVALLDEFNNPSTQPTKNFSNISNVLNSYKNDEQKLIEHIEWIKKMPLFKKIDDNFLSHAFGLPYYRRRFNQKFKKAFYSNNIFNDYFKYEWENFKEYKIFNVFGHCTSKSVIKGSNYIGIDTGACYGNKLTAFNLNTGEIYSVNTNKKDI